MSHLLRISKAHDYKFGVLWILHKKAELGDVIVILLPRLQCTSSHATLG
jgi:hypothetical protein